MPIDTKNNLVFIHIPKTGGSSIEHMLGLIHRENLFSPTPLEGLIPATKTPQHFTWLELRQNLPSAFLDTAYKFAFVRNPWDRFVSEYCWRRGWYFKDVGARADYYYERLDMSSLDSFVRVLELPQDKRIDARRGFDGHLETQFSFIVGETGKVAVDFVGRFENFEMDLRKVAVEAGLKVGPVGHIRKSHREKDYRTYYTSYSRSAVQSFYRDDIREFGYEF